MVKAALHIAIRDQTTQLYFPNLIHHHLYRSYGPKCPFTPHPAYVYNLVLNSVLLSHSICQMHLSHMSTSLISVNKDIWWLFSIFCPAAWCSRPDVIFTKLVSQARHLSVTRDSGTLYLSCPVWLALTEQMFFINAANDIYHRRSCYVEIVRLLSRHLSEVTFKCGRLHRG